MSKHAPKVEAPPSPLLAELREFVATQNLNSAAEQRLGEIIARAEKK